MMQNEGAVVELAIDYLYPLQVAKTTCTRGGAKCQPPADTIVRRPFKECAVIHLTTVPMHSTRAGAMHGKRDYFLGAV